MASLSFFLSFLFFFLFSQISTEVCFNDTLTINYNEISIIVMNKIKKHFLF